VKEFKDPKPLSIKAKVNAFAAKFYYEQLPDGIDALIVAIKQIDKKSALVLCIQHDKDEVSDGIWEVAKEKPHFHLLYKNVNRNTNTCINTVLQQLHICYRQGLDDVLLANRGIETIGESFPGYALYLTHETKSARLDAKYIYDIQEIISNLTIPEIEQIRDGYTRITEGSTKLSISDLASLDLDAFALGYALKNFNAWYNALPFNVRSHSKLKTIKESYTRGVESRLEEGTEINRLCVYIMGNPNTGKTYAAKEALAGQQILNVGGGGSGKFDNLRPDHDAIILDDDICPNLLNMTDNYICRAYRRNNNNSIWAGRYFVVTSNLSFTNWLITCGFKIENPSTVHFRMLENKHYSAMLSRFFVCSLIPDANGGNKLALISASTRGSEAEQHERLNMFIDFKNKFNSIISEYTPSATQIDYSAFVDNGCCLPNIL